MIVRIQCLWTLSYFCLFFLLCGKPTTSQLKTCLFIRGPPHLLALTLQICLPRWYSQELGSVPRPFSHCSGIHKCLKEQVRAQSGRHLCVPSRITAPQAPDDLGVPQVFQPWLVLLLVLFYFVLIENTLSWLEINVLSFFPMMSQSKPLEASLTRL